MNNGNLNKLVTNYPVELTEEEIANLSGTLAPVIAACGGGGGGTGGKIYTGIGFVTVNNTTNQIGLTNEANTKINQDIPSAVSSFPDSIQYAKKTYVDNTFQTKDAMSAYWTSAETKAAYAEDIAILIEQINGKENKLTFAYDNDKISAINGSALAGQGGVTGDYYSASNPSGFITPTTLEPILQNKHYVTSSNEIIQGSAQYGLTTAGWTVIQGAGGGTGITEVSHDSTLTGNGNSQALGVNFNHVQPKGNYVSYTDISDMATQTWVGTQGYIKVIPSEYITDTELQATLVDYATNNLVQTTSAEITAMIPSTAGLASENDLQIVSAGVDYVSAHAITAHQSLTNYYQKTETSSKTEISTALGNKVDKPVSLNNKYLVLRTNNDGSISGWVDFNDNVYSKSEADGRYQKKEDMGSYLTTAKYATDSATFVTETELETVSGEITALIPTNYVTSGDYISGNSQYALTSGGWAKVKESGLSLPVNVGTGNDVSQTSAIGAIGNNCSAGTKSFAFSYKGASAYENSFVVNDDNIAGHNSFAWGWGSTADVYSMAGGNNVSAYNHSLVLAQGDSTNKSQANNYSIAFGNAVTANNWSYVFGRGLNFSGNDDATTGIGALVVGGWNNTTANAIFVLANGTGNGSRSDAFVVYRNGAVREGTNTTANGPGAHVEGVDAGASGQGAHAGGYGTHTTGIGNFIHGTFLNFASPDGTTVSNTPVFVGGTLNATTAQNYNDHGGYLQIMGNGTYTGGGQGNNSDAYILYRDGSISAAGKISANGMFAVSTDATLFGQSRIANVGDTTALGTNWMGVTNDGQGFLKSISGNNVGSLNGTSIQINYKPNNAYGEITVKNSNAGTDGDSKIVHVPTASYNNMSVSSQEGLTTGPNYFVVKTASGFDIGAAVINVTAMPQSPQANTYYFIYDT